MPTQTHDLTHQLYVCNRNKIYVYTHTHPYVQGKEIKLLNDLKPLLGVCGGKDMKKLDKIVYIVQWVAQNIYYRGKYLNN